MQRRTPGGAPCDTHVRPRLDRRTSGASLRRVARLASALAAVAVLVALAWAPSARAAAPAPDLGRVRVIVPDADNLQYLAFWAALGGGDFRREGIDVDVVVPRAPALAQSAFTNGEAPVAVLTPPMYARLAAERFPFALVAALLQNDPIDLVVRRSVAEERGVSRDRPLRDRLERLRGVKIGVAPGPPTRLRALFASQGMDADRDLSIAIVHGREQNDAFARGEVDALYAHTPFLERAIVDQSAVVAVDQAAGEVPALASRQVHALGVTTTLIRERPGVVRALVRAIAAAERRAHADRAATVDALLRALPTLDRRHVDALVALYAPAVPETPRVSASGFAQAVALYPANGAAPDLRGVDLDAFVAPSFAEAAAAPPSRKMALALLLGAALAIAFVVVMRERSPSPNV